MPEIKNQRDEASAFAYWSEACLHACAYLLGHAVIRGLDSLARWRNFPDDEDRNDYMRTVNSIEPDLALCKTVFTQLGSWLDLRNECVTARVSC